LVIGAGLSGAAVAYSLAKRGWAVTVIDQATGVGAGASGLPVGLAAPHVSPDDNILSRLTRAGVRATLQRAQALLKSLPVTPRPSPSLTHPNLEAAAKTIAQALNPETWQRNEVPRFNEAADKALIDLIFQTDLDRFVHTATFHKIEGLWTLRNVQRTLQAFSPRFKAAPTRP
jgi:glycine/D-amino acid oxidase-like deaminating enzyme